MAESQKSSSKDMRVRNVSLHSRGKTEKGTLYLYRHHLVFSYMPDWKSASDSRAISGTHSAHNGASRNTTSLEAPSRESSDSTAKSPNSVTGTKARTKDIWIPYPMINHCVLRPSHAQGRSYDQNLYVENTDGSAEDSAFPPVYGTSSFDRPSTDSARLAPYASPQRPSSPAAGNPISIATETGRSPALRIRRRDFQMMAFHFHPSSSDKPPDDAAREVFYSLRSRCVVDRAQGMHAFHFKAPQEELSAGGARYDARREFSRMGIGGKAAEGPGSAWRITEINKDYEYSPTYPSVLCVPCAVSDNILKYGGVFRSKSRIPALTYLHPNGGSISRSSQPMVGLKNKRSPQDERLVSAIFSSHTPSQSSPSDSPPQSATASRVQNDDQVHSLPISQSDTALDETFEDMNATAPRKRVYGSTRRNMIMDARPKMNAMANVAGGGGFEDVSNYTGPSGTTVERIFLGIANIHTMRKSLDRVIESLANADYLDMKPNQELLRNSGWLAHIAGILDSAEMVARVVGLGGSHVLVHCSDGWDRTAQVAALAEIMLDPFYRSLAGFITLVQKDFMSFGHKFNHRHGIQGSEKWFDIENERVAPSRPKEGSVSEQGGLNTFGSKAFSGAKNWFEKNRNTIFRQNDSRSDLDASSSRPPSPPPNPLLHAPATANTKKDREHKTELQEISPVFHQFLDAVFQLQYHFPNAFEFNERFLRRLFYQAYAGQYGEFLFNTEKDRTENQDKFASAWPHFLSRRQEFTNPDYVAKVEDPLLFPQRQGREKDMDVRWWSSLFGRKDEDMNTPRALAPPDPDVQADMPTLSAEPSAVSLDYGIHTAESSGSEAPAAIKETRSYSSLDAVRNSLSSTLATFQIGGTEQAPPEQASSASQPARPALEQRGTDADILAKYITSPETQESDFAMQSIQQMNVDEGDPLGVSSKVSEVSRTKLDVSAFARESAYSDR